MVNEEIKEKNYSIFLKKLEEVGVDTSSITDEIAVLIKNATFTISNENGLAYDGSLLHTVLRTLTPYALNINNVLPKNLQVEKNTLIKVCLLSHISKCEMFEPNDNEWEKEKRGLMYKYSKNTVALKMGMRSIIFAQNLGIKFTPEEMEAMTIMDRSCDDEQAKYFSSTLSTIIKQANELTYLQTRLNR